MPSVLTLTAFLLREEGGLIEGGGGLIRAFTVYMDTLVSTCFKCEDFNGKCLLGKF